ncbi:diguanylate cyclase [Methylomicrobium sp. Wu6]|uniref:diguanylate cyclase n=1 Tax=Methylomicrobium sp. Wu6 TaxID=3107928 RepID=UPI002DD6B0B8|nr:diguanylate cyclase [Methylomicrobium sp. Wu6]MEC4749668.1 diguanylate cyclase [Methylomicrobium sp. Wu6]
MKYINVFLSILLLQCGTTLAFAARNRQLDVIDLQLRWHHQFQFAGYYAAVAMGYYQQEGLEVRLHAGDPSHQPVQEVLSGRAHYAEGNSEVLFQRLKGKPLIALAAIFQHSPSILLTRKDTDIVSAHDLVGKKVMLMNRTEDADFLTMLLNEGISASQINIIPSSYRIEDLIAGKIDAFNAYSTNEPFFLKQRHIDYNIIEPSNYRVDFYSDIFFTSEQELRDHPKRVEKMLRATLKGWRYAMDHPDQIIDLLLKTYHVEKSRAHLEFEAAEMRKLILPDIIEIGHMNPERWQHMTNTFVKAGLIPANDLLDGFIYSNTPKRLPEWVIPVLAATSGIILAILAVIYYLVQLNRRLALTRSQLHIANTVLSGEIVEREAIELSLRASEARYRSLFENMLGGFAFCQMLYRNGQPDDLIYLEVNPAFAALTGLTNVVGKKISEAIPGIKESNPEIFTIYARVAEGGPPEKFETFVKPLELWFSIAAYHTGGHCFVAMVENITDRKQLQHKYEHMAQIDYLTGLANRRHFMQQAEAELARTLRYGGALSLLMLDLDNFKQINDNYGHLTGDRVLQTFSELCQSTLREADLIGRLGGEEFVIMLPATGIAEAVKVAERLRKMIADIFIPLEDGQPLRFTVSIGVTALNELCAHIDAMLQKADQSLYKAKEEGRNRVVYADI